jgi:glycosyltransferase involved in cell wall biosynthesis
VSVVVATHDRPHRLERLLRGLGAQELPPNQFEVIVVDDGSGPETAQVLADAARNGTLTLRTARNETAAGPAAARNVGWRIADAPLVAFTDDDCIPTRRWLSAALELATAHPDAIIQGATEPDPDELHDRSPMSHTVRQNRLGPSFETCNMFYPRAVLERMRGFDESFGPASAGEDTDLAWRALDSGCTALFAPDALVLHAVERIGRAGTLRRAQRWTSCVRVISEHPQSRSILERDLFWNIWHYLLLRSAVSILGPRWLRRWVLARHLLALRDRSVALGASWTSVPFLLLYDVVETRAIVRGAIRYRTPVL